MKNDFQFKKKYGQNFLRDDSIPRKIVQYSDIPDDTLVIEIGPGAGALTRQLSKIAKQVLAYEIDTSLQDALNEEFSMVDNVDIIYDDFLKRSISDDLKPYSYKNLYVVANLPYYITTPILFKLLEEKIDIDKIVVMVQKEVGDRLCSLPGSRDYGSISVYFQYYFDIKKLFLVSRNCFVPKPNVDSVILCFEKKKERLELKNVDLFFQLVRDSFQFKRKTLKNNLKQYNLEKISCILEKYGYELSVRAEELSLEIFVDISNNL